MPKFEITDDAFRVVTGQAPPIAVPDGLPPVLPSVQDALDDAERYTRPGTLMVMRRVTAERAIAERIKMARHDLDVFISSIESSTPIRARVETGSVVERLTEGMVAFGAAAPILVLGRRGATATSGVPGAIAYRVASMTRVPVLMHKATES